MDKHIPKLIADQGNWAKVSEELQAEQIKLAFYDNTVIPLLGDLNEKQILDYGCGPGVLLSALQRLGAEAKGYDISVKFRQEAAAKIGANNIYSTISQIPDQHFEFVICNLVLCIVPEAEVECIIANIKRALKHSGLAFIGFCNPKLLDVPETKLDFRPAPEHAYQTNHSYMKTKKEGSYQIIENHRPIEWYHSVYQQAGLKLIDTIFTPEYELNGRKIQDFIISQLSKLIKNCKVSGFTAQE